MSKKYLTKEDLKDYPEIPVGFARDFRGEVLGDFIVLYRTPTRCVDKGKAAWIVQCNKCRRYMYKGSLNPSAPNKCPCKNHPIKGTILQKKWEIGDIIIDTTKTAGYVNKFECKCLKCGAIQIISHRRMNSGEIIKCKTCEPNVRSWGEEKIANLLRENNIFFVPQKRFLNFNKYSFDFFLPKYSTIIEFDGQQHFNGKGNWNDYEKTRNNDLLKNKFCFDNGISLIRIPYDLEWGYEDLFPNTSQFLLTPENEQYYYERRV